jgi:uncharacterized membrane protein
VADANITKGSPRPEPGRLKLPASVQRADRLRLASLAFAILGIGVAGYLTWIKLAHTQAFCSGVGDCEAVNSSIYSQINGVPVAALGLTAYLALAALFLLEGRWVWLRDYAPLASFGLALTGTLYSAYLTYIELFVIHAVCPYCVASAVLMTGILVIAIVRLIRGPDTEAAED